MGFWEWLLAAMAGVTVLFVGIREIARAVRWVGSLISDFREFMQDWRGEDPRPEIGYTGRKGVMARIYDMELQNAQALEVIAQLQEQVKNVHHEVVPNGGGSLRDAVNRIEQTVAAPKEEVKV